MTDLLVHLQKSLGLLVSVAHVDHQLRAESQHEQTFVGRLCRTRWHVPFLPLKVTVAGSLQEAARHARYEALQGCASEVGATFIAVAHTQDDQAETVLDRLLRGASITGLAGIKLLREDGVIRPVLNLRRSQLHSHLTRQSLSAVRDPSNVDTSFQRVRIREGLLPALHKEDPAIVKHLCDLANDALAISEHLQDEGGLLLTQCQDSADRLLLEPKPLRSASRPVRRAALRIWLRHLGGLKRGQQEEIEALLLTGNSKARVLLGDGWHVQLLGERLALLKRPTT